MAISYPSLASAERVAAGKDTGCFIVKTPHDAARSLDLDRAVADRPRAVPSEIGSAHSLPRYYFPMRPTIGETRFELATSASRTQRSSQAELLPGRANGKV